MLFNVISTATFLFATVPFTVVSSFPLDSDPGTSESELQNSTIILSARDTGPNLSGHNVLAISYYDHCAGSKRDLGGKDTDVWNYIINTCQQVAPPGGAMIVDWYAAGFNKITLYKDAHCNNKIEDQEAQIDWGVTCLSLPKSAKVLSFKGTVVE